MSASLNSRASAAGPMTARCAVRVSPSVLASTPLNQGALETWSQPASVSVPAAARARLRKFLRSDRWLFMGLSRDLDGVAAGDHRSQIVPNARNDHHCHVHENEQHRGCRREEMD